MGMAVWLRPAAESWRIAARERVRGARHPFSLWITLSRNPLRTLPMMLATLVASLGVASVVVLADSIVRTAVAGNDYLREAFVVRADEAKLDEVEAFLRQQPQGPLLTRLGPTTFVRGRLFQFDMFFPVLLVRDGEAASLVQRYGGRVTSGRLPQPGALEVALPEAMARARHTAIGDTVGGPDDFTPLPLKVVGLLDGPRWIGVASATGVQSVAPSVQQGLLVYQTDSNSRAALERATNDRFGTSTQVKHWTPQPQKDGVGDVGYTDDLRLMLTFIVAINATVLSIVGGLLALLYFRQRQAEFVLLSILGRTKMDLAKRLIAEIGLVVGAGWLGGLLVTQLLLAIIGQLVLADRAVILDFVNPGTLLQTLPLAFATIAVSSAVTLASLYRFDPITRLQARP